jgi:hypothetical protein
MTHSTGTLQNSAILRRASSGISRLDAQALELLHRMLGRLGLELSRRRDMRQQGQVNENGPVASQFIGLLADGLQKRQAFDIADRAADLAQHEIGIPDVVGYEFLDGIGHMGNDLHRGAQIVAAALACDHGGIDAPGRDVVAAARGHAGEALVMAQVQIGFGPVIGDEDLAMLERAHRPRIDVEIGVQLAESDLESPRLQKSAERG